MAGNMVLLCGIPRSGKSTYAQQRKDTVRGCCIVCPDEIRLALHGQRFEPRAEPMVWAMAEVMARSLLAQGHEVIIDATNTTTERRKPWIRLARDFAAPLSIKVFQVPEYVAHGRNKAPIGVVEGYSSLPSTVIERMAKQWEPLTDEERSAAGVIEYRGAGTDELRRYPQ